MSSAALEEWNNQFGDVELFTSKPASFEMELDVAYPVRITDAKVIESNRGSTQVELTIDIHDRTYDNHDGDVLGIRREWLTLPKQESDTNLSREVVEKVTQRRYQDILRVASAAAPARFALYKAKVVGEGGQPSYLDFNDETISGSQFKVREDEIQKAIVNLVEALREGDADAAEILKGTGLWLVRATNSKNPKYPYSNWYAKPPRKV